MNPFAAPMPDTSAGDARILRGLARMSGGAALVVFIIAAIVLVGWTTGSNALTTVAPRYPPLVPPGAVAFAFAGLALWLLRAEAASGARALAARAFATVVAFIGGASTAFHAGRGILGERAADAVALGLPPEWVPYPLPAVAFLLCGASLLLLNSTRPSARAFSQAAALLVGLLGLVALVGYAYDLTYPAAIAAGRTGLAAPILAATNFALLSLGTLAARPRRGFVAPFVGAGPPGSAGRRLVASALSGPLILGALALASIRTGVLSLAAAVSVFALANTAIFATLAWTTTSALQKHEESERRADGLVRSTLRAAPDAIVVVDARGRIRFTNDNVATMLGYEEGDLLGKSVEALLPARLRKAHVVHREVYAQEPVARPMGSGLDLVALHKDGREIPVEVSLSPTTTEAGPATIATIRDITARIEADKTKTMLATVAATSIEAIIAKDMQGMILTWNNAAEGLYGYTAEEAIGRPITIIFPSGSERDEENILAAVRRGEVLGARDVERVRKDGTRIWVSTTTAPMRDVSGRIVGAASIQHDITERKQADDHIRASLREKEALLREIHHRVKNNLQVTSALLQIQSQHVADQATRDLFLDSMDRVRSMALVHEKLYESPSLSAIDFAAYVRDLTSELVRAYSAPDQRIDLTIDAPPVQFDIDTAVGCGLILNELVSNAIKHAFPGRAEGHVHIVLDQEGDDTYRLRVRDDGIGMPPEIDLHTTRTMGLRLVARLAKQLGGRATIHRNDGTDMQVRFPIPRGGREAVQKTLESPMPT